ncbi:MAG: acyl-CoA dehydrogenase [Granulosicoccus sp.]|nr:acyl-CoA dehydrogenase [Granulosicoccus sp.]
MIADYDLTLDEGRLQEWLGRTQHASDVISLHTCQRMSATVGLDPDLTDAAPLPPLWHWLFFHDAVSTSELGNDGHPRLGGFLPPVALPRRMWAGGRLRFKAPLLIGMEASRESRITSVVRKSGRSGELCFVTVEHTVRQQQRVSLVEEHDIVYREAAPKAAAEAAPGVVPEVAPEAAPEVAATSAPVDDPRDLPVSGKVRAAGALLERSSPHSLKVRPSVSALFRYSALTFNSHRIHFDRDYCRNEEHYAGLVFHGPLTATLMAHLAQSVGGKPLSSFDFRALAPLLDTDVFDIEAHEAGPLISVSARKADGQLAMQASATF